MGTGTGAGIGTGTLATTGSATVQVVVVAPMPEHRARAAAGTWDWFNQVQVTLLPDYSARGTNNEVGTWRLADPANRVYVIQWKAGWVDTLTLSPDGNTLDGSNREGTHVWGRRRR